MFRPRHLLPSSPLAARLLRLGNVQGLTLVIAIAVSLSLIASSLWMWRTSAQLDGLVDTGQAEREFMMPFLKACPPKRSIPHSQPMQLADPGCVKRAYDHLSPLGLRYLKFTPPALSGPGAPPDLSRSVAFGDRLSPPDLETDRRLRGHPIAVLEGERHAYVAPPNAPPVGAPTVLIEYEPTRLRSHRRQRWITLLVGLAGALSFFGGALLLNALVRQRLVHDARLHAQAQFALLGRMSAVLAHDLRNPLASAKGRAELVVELLPAKSPLAERAQGVVSELRRVEAVSRSLLDFIRSGRAQRADCDPLALAQEAARHAQGAVTVKEEGRIPSWSLDRYALERALLNLLQNAREAQGDEGAPILLRLGVHKDGLRFTVDDHGPGFPLGVELGTFLTTTRADGTGLGLASSLQTVRAHGGRMSLGAAPGGGARVEIVIPPGERTRGAPTAGM